MKLVKLSNVEGDKTYDNLQNPSICLDNNNKNLIIYDNEKFLLGIDNGKREVVVSEKIIQLASSNGHLFALTETALFLVDDTFHLHALNIVFGQDDITITHITITEDCIILICSDSHIWTLPVSTLNYSGEKIKANTVNFNNSAYSTKQLAAGRNHCAAVIVFDTFEEKPSLTDEKSKDAEKSNNAEPGTSSMATEPSRNNFDKFLSSFRHPFTKIKKNPQGSKWYAYPSADLAENGIELTIRPSGNSVKFPQSPFLSGATSFSFVSLDTLISSESSSSGSDVQIPISNDSKQKLPIVNSGSEIWTWGSNEYGQLGIGNQDNVRMPVRVKTPAIETLKIAAGNDFTLALMATGEVYGWGCNSNGQVAKVASGRTKAHNPQFILEPTLLKLGSTLFAVDIAATTDISFVAVIEQGTADIYIYQLSLRNALNGSSVIRRCFEAEQKIQWPLRIFSLSNDDLIVAQYNLTEQRGCLAFPGAYCSVVKALRFSIQLRSLVTMLMSSNVNDNRSLKALQTALTDWAMGIAEFCRSYGVTNLQSDSERRNSISLERLILLFTSLHCCIIDAAAFTLLTAELSTELGRMIETMSLEQSTESSKDFRRLFRLFQIPRRHFFELAPIFDEAFATTHSLHFWQRLETEFTRNEHWSYLTAQHLSRTFRNDILLCGIFGEDVCRIRCRQTPLTTRNFFGKSPNEIYIWSDAVGILLNGSLIRLNFELLYLLRISGETPTLKLSDPESVFDLEFLDSEKLNEFCDVLENAWSYGRVKENNAENQTVKSPFEKRCRLSTYTYSPTHSSFPNCVYNGYWLDGQPNGKGAIRFPDGREYRGRFHKGRIEGIGEMEYPLEDASAEKSLMTSILQTPSKIPLIKVKGCFKNGQMNGLGYAELSNGDSYNGYWLNDKMHGHGVYRMIVDGNMNVYVGAWKNGFRDGYGVESSNKERYLGEWCNGKRHGLGALVNIDGVFHEGTFENNRFLNGRVIYETARNEWDLPTFVEYEGQFDGINKAAGKGVLRLNRGDQIVGTFYGSILGSELSISNAVYSHISVNSGEIDDEIFLNGPKRGKYALDETNKWNEIFIHFLSDQLGIEKFDWENSDEIPKKLTTKAWESIASTITKLRAHNIATFGDQLERIPKFEEDWSPRYYSMVSDYWNTCVSNEHHPFGRLIRGIVEIFSYSYSSSANHLVMYDSAILEFQQLMAKCYSVIRILFVNLPPVGEMYSPISIDSPSFPSKTHESERLNIPSCDFLIECFFSSCYADIYTIYCEKCQTADRIYWDRVLQLNTYRDDQLFRYFDVDRSNEEDHNVVGEPKVYQNAIRCFQELICTVNPVKKLSILIQTFNGLSDNTKSAWNADSLLPNFIFVVVRSQIQHLGAEIRLIADFVPTYGENSLMFTILQSSYIQICKERYIC